MIANMICTARLLFSTDDGMATPCSAEGITRVFPSQ